jgi:hypothetical protein
MANITQFKPTAKMAKQGRNWADPDKPSAGYIAWLLWGGDEGQRWAARNREKLRLTPHRG